MRYTIMAGLMLTMAATGLAQTPADRPDRSAMQRREGDDIALLLGLSAAQRPALDAMLAADAPPPRDAMRDRPDAPPAGFDAMLSLIERHDSDRAARDAGRIAAGRRFYAALDARQKAAFDALLRLRHGPHGPGGADGPRGDGPPHGRPPA